MADEAAQLLDDARAEMRLLDLTPIPLDLREVLDVNVAMLEGISQSHAIAHETSADADVVVHVDPGALQQILGHLLENAVKYSPCGSTVVVAARREEDGVLIDIDTCMESSAVGVPTDYPEKEPARSTGRLSGDLAVLREAMNPERLLQSRRVEINQEAVRLAKEKAGGELLVRGNCDQAGFSLAMLCYGMSDFMADLTDEDLEDEILGLIDRATDLHLAFHRLVRQTGADITSFGDSSCGPDLISRDMYRRFSLPFHRRIAEEARASGVPVVCHICGKLDKILFDVAGAGFPAVEADYKTNVADAARVFGENHVTMFGPIDPSGVFFFGTPEIVRAETQRVLETFRGRGLVIGAGCALPAGTPEANIRAFTETVRAYEI
jgi:uroporphyrinogen decarboxylase